MNPATGDTITTLGRAAQHAWAWANTHLATLDALAWTIGALNPLSAVLVGPALAYLLRHRPTLATRLQGTGWLVLALAQTAFLTFGWLTGYAGFRWAQALMIPAAAANFTMWWIARHRDPVTHLIAFAKQLDQAGRIKLTHRIDLKPDIPMRDTHLYATAMRLTKLDASGKPIPGATYDLTGPTAHRDQAIRWLNQHPDHIRMSFTTETPLDTEALNLMLGQDAPNPTSDTPDPVDPVDNQVDDAPDQCRGPMHTSLGGPPERCVGVAGHEGDCSA